MLTNATLIENMIAQREVLIEKAQREVETLKASLAMIREEEAKRPVLPIQPTAAVRWNPDTAGMHQPIGGAMGTPVGQLLGVGVAMLGVVAESVASSLWNKEADALLADGKPHELKELAERAHRAAARGADMEKVRKHLHVWLSRKVERGEVQKLERGWYQLVRQQKVVAG